MKVKELDRRVMLELIEHKYQELKSNKIRIDENDLNYHSSNIVDILLDLEIKTKGKVKLLSIIPENDRTESYTKEKENEDNLFSFKKKYPDCFYINYNPESITLDKRDGKIILTLSKVEGLCRRDENKKLCYPIKKQRYEIISVLGKKYISTEKISKLIQEPNLQKIRIQIGSMRKIISKKLKLGDNDIIETSKTGQGYRISDSFIIEK